MNYFLLNPGGWVVKAKLLPLPNADLKTWLMRISFVYIAMISSALQLLANTGKGQNIESEKVTIELNDETLRAMVTKIEAQTTFRFAYLVSRYDNNKVASMPKAARTIKETLDIALHDLGILYRQHDHTIVLYTPTPSSTTPIEQSISGNVTDKDGGPMAGVNIIVKGSTRGTTTDAQGTFRILANPDDILVFSFIGHKTIENLVGSTTTMNVTMQLDVATLGEVTVNAGYYQVEAREQTGSITGIKREDLEKVTSSNPLQALEGRTPGVYVQQTTGVPGGGYNIQIRGINSLRSNGNYPLYIVDGIPFSSASISSGNVGSSVLPDANPLAGINPSDIEKIDILKDADATAIYGSRGANGVVLITTKKGNTTSPKLDINISNGIGKVTRLMSLLNTKQWIEMRKEAFHNDGIEINSNNAPDLVLWDTTRYTDWQKELVGGTANFTNASASFSAGTGNIQTSFGIGYYRETSVYPTTKGLQKASGNFNLNYRSPNNRLTTSAHINYVYTVNNLPGVDLMSTALSLSPNAPKAFDENGNLNWETNWNNPYGILRGTYTGKTNNLISGLAIQYELIAGLSAKASLGYNTLQLTEIRINPLSSFNPAQNPAASAFNAANTTYTWIIEPQLDYKKKFSKATITALIGSTFQETTQNSWTLFSSGYSSDALLGNLSASKTLIAYPGANTNYRYNGVYGRLNLAWDKRYFLNLTARRDGSSRFGPGKQFAKFGAVGAAWIFSEESFFNSISTISHGKLRGSIGTTGSDQIGDYQYLDSYSSNGLTYNGYASLIPTRLTNPNYSWETNQKIEGAIELGFFGDDLIVSANYYRNRSSNQLVGYPLPTITGQSSVQYNLPATVQNTGLEIIISSSIIKESNFSWESTLNLSLPRNKLVKYPGLAGSTYANIYTIGKPVNSQKKFKHLGVDTETGLYKFEDKNQNGSDLDYPDDLALTMKIGPSLYGGFNNTVRYKNFEFSTLIMYTKQTGPNYLNFFFVPPGNMYNNQPVEVMSRWQKSGDQTNTQKFTQTFEDTYVRYSYMSVLGDKSISDASFFRVKNISLAWRISQDWFKGKSVTGCRIYIQAQNLLTVTNYAGGDPENMNLLNLPPLKTFTIGASLTL